MDVDRKYIKTKFVDTEKYLKKADEIISISAEELLSDLDTQLKAERLFEIISQTIIDICTHLVASLQLGVPATYSSCIDLLAKEKIVSKTLASDLIKIVKMRNIVVHQYAVIDYSILYASLKHIRTDFLKYKQEIIKWLSN